MYAYFIMACGIILARIFFTVINVDLTFASSISRFTLTLKIRRITIEKIFKRFYLVLIDQIQTNSIVLTVYSFTLIDINFTHSPCVPRDTVAGEVVYLKCFKYWLKRFISSSYHLILTFSMVTTSYFPKNQFNKQPIKIYLFRFSYPNPCLHRYISCVHFKQNFKVNRFQKTTEI